MLSRIEESDTWNDFLIRCNLNDLMSRQQDEREIPPFKEGSSKWIDYIVGSESILKATISAGIDAINSGASSDHCLVQIDLHAKILLGDLLCDPEPPKSRKLQSLRPNRVRKYKELPWKYLQVHNVQERAQELYQ